MDRLWAPWRIGFILKGCEEEECFLCQYPKEDNDEANLILFRGKHNFIILNAYPYNTGHLLIAPYKHIGSLNDLKNAAANENYNLVRLGVRLLTRVMQPAGFNIGMNLGRVAGAGIADHIHTHIVPRWQGDSNFMPVVSDTKVLPESLAMTYKKLKEGIAEVL